MAALLLVLTLAVRTQAQELSPKLHPANYPHKYTFHESYTLHWECTESKDAVKFLIQGRGNKWYALGIIPEGLAARMENADMAIGLKVNSLPTVTDWHGSKKAPPVRDAKQDLTEVEGFVNETHTFYAWTRKRQAVDNDGDGTISLGPVEVLWAFGPASKIEDPTKFEKHLPRSNAAGRLEFCEAPPSTTTVTTTTTETKTSTTATTTTASTTTTTTSTTTTTTKEADPNRAPLAPPNTTSDGYIDLQSLRHHGNEQGLRALYFDFDNRPEIDDLIGRYLSSEHCTVQGAHHGDMPDSIDAVAQLNFPGNIRHGMGSPENYTQNFCTAFEGWLEIPEDGLYTFEMSCSDSCRFSLACSTDRSAGNCGNPSSKNKFGTSYQFRHDANNGKELYYRTAGMSVTGRNTAGDEPSTYAGRRTLDLDLPAGLYPIKMTHAVGPDSWGKFDPFKYAFGPQLVFKWTTPNASHSQVIPAKAFVHRAPRAMHFEHYPAATEKWFDGNFESYEYIREDGPHEGERNDGIAIIDLGYVFAVDKVEVYAKDSGSKLEISVSETLNDARNVRRRAYVCGIVHTTGTKDVLKLTGEKMTVPYNETLCSGAKGRYVTLRLAAKGTPHGFRQFKIQGTPMSPTKQPLFATVARMPKLDRTPFRKQYYQTGVPGMHRVYASVVDAHYRASSGKELQGRTAHRLLNEGSNDDSESWLLQDFSTGSFILDLGFEVSVAAIRLLNSHDHAYSYRGTKDLRIEAGSRGTLVNNAAGGDSVHANTSSALARGKICVEAIGEKHGGNKIMEKGGATLLECQQWCFAESNNTDPSKRCEAYTMYYYGTCRLYNSERSEVNAKDSNAMTGLATCDETKLPVWDPASAIDGDMNTCFRMPAGERHPYLLVDLGETTDVDDIVISTGKTNAHIKAYVGNTVDEVTHEGSTVNGWGDGASSTKHCNGGQSFNIQYESTYKHHYKAPAEVRIPCQASGRYVAIRNMQWNQDVNLCEIKVHVRPEASWTVIDKTVLLPNIQYRYQTPVPGSSTSWRNEVGLGPWVVRELESPVMTRYLKFTAESFYLRGAGLARVQVWSDAPIPRFQIQSRASNATAPLPGLRAELHDYIGGLHSRMTTPARLSGVFRETLPRSATAVPVVNFYQDTFAKTEFRITVTGEVQVGPSSGAKEVAVQFDVPFGSMPGVEVTLHTKHYDPEASNDRLSKELSRFRLSATSITTHGFVLVVATSDKKKWDLTSSTGSMPLTVAYTADAKFPTYQNDHMIEDPENKRFTKDTNIRLTGQLIPQWTGEHKIYLVGGPLIRMVLDSIDYKLAYSYSDEREHNKTTNKWEYVGIRKSAQLAASVYLTKGQAVPIELQVSTALKHWGSRNHGVTLLWEREGVGRSIVPTSALQHTPRTMCLSEALSPWGTDHIYTAECDALQPGQKWRLDGNFIRADGALGTLNSGAQATRCLVSSNHPFDDTKMRGSDRLQLPPGEIQTCGYGGIARSYAFYEKSTPEEMYRNAQLWQYEPETGLIRSLSNRPFDVNGVTPCKDTYVASKLVDGNKKYDIRYQCDLNHTVAPFMCLKGERTSAAVAGVRKHLATLAPCTGVTTDPGLQWDMIPVVSTTPRPPAAALSKLEIRGEVVFEGRYERIPHYLFHSPAKTQQLKNTAYNMQFRCNSKDGCPACPQGTENNTCLWACNGVCEENEVGMWRNGGVNVGNCAAGTDTYDCDYSRGAVRECERACSKDDECTGFRTSGFEVNPGLVNCDFTGNSMEKNVYWDPQWTLYKKIMRRSEGIETPAVTVALSPAPSCSSYKDAKRCPGERCKWVPEGETNSSALLEDPDCSDTNTYPEPSGAFFSCAQYVEISRQEKFYGKDDDLCSTEYVGKICAITCNHTEYCAGAKYACMDIDVATTTTTVQPLPESGAGGSHRCAGAAVALVNGRCRCLSDAGVCTNAGEMHKAPCRSASAGGHASVASWFPPSCTTCSCTENSEGSWFDPDAPSSNQERGGVNSTDANQTTDGGGDVTGSLAATGNKGGGGKAAAGVIVTLLLLAGVCTLYYNRKRGGRTHLFSFALNVFSTTDQKFDKFQSDADFCVENSMYEQGAVQGGAIVNDADGGGASARASGALGRPTRPSRSAPAPGPVPRSPARGASMPLAGTTIDASIVDDVGGGDERSSTSIVPALAPTQRRRKKKKDKGSLGLLNDDGMMTI